MRFKIWKQSLFTLTTLLITVGFILRLALQHKLILYIHPRYIWFAGTMSCIAAFLIAAHIRSNLMLMRKAGTYTFIDKKQLLLGIPIILLVACMLLTPQRSLSSSAALQRGLAQVSIAQNGSSFTGSSLAKYSTNFDNLSFHDWVTILNSGQFAASYVDKQANLSGFVAAGQGDINTFYLSRFFITCCAVDATPIGIKVSQSNWRAHYKENEWLQIKGTVTASSDQAYILTPMSIQAIPEPQDPYAN